MSRVSKGKYAENKARKELQKDGWVVEKQNYQAFASLDFFKVYDLMAIKGNGLKFVQVKSNISHVSVARRKILVLLEAIECTNPIYDIEIWLYQPRKPFRKFILQNNLEFKEWKNSNK